MDLGSRGRRAIVGASSRGLGSACADALAREGVDVTINGRDAEALGRPRAHRRAHGVVGAGGGRATSVTVRPARRLLDACPEPDILVNNNGGPTPGGFATWEREDWIDASMPTCSPRWR